MPTKKVLFIGDVQADDRTPSSRKDDYLLSILDKINECVNIAKAKKVDALVLLGDLFDRMDPPGRCRNSVLSIFYKAKDYFPIYAVIGNHDIKSSMPNLPNSALGTFIETDIFKYTDYEPELGIGFGHYTSTIEDDLKNGVYSDKPYFIWAIHANISTMTMPYEHVIFSSLKWHPNCKMVVSGHLHREMADNYNGVFFSNPGPIGRDELNEYTLVHKPGVLYVEYEPYGEITHIETIKLKNVLPASDVFKIEEAQEKKHKNVETEKYMQQISKMTFWTAGPNKYESIRESAKLKNVDPVVVELVIETLKEVNSLK
jgi:DNA repair exonuclease SbcCD nuclease subunit